MVKIIDTIWDTNTEYGLRIGLVSELVTLLGLHGIKYCSKYRFIGLFGNAFKMLLTALFWVSYCSGTIRFHTGKKNRRCHLSSKEFHSESGEET